MCFCSAKNKTLKCATQPVLQRVPKAGFKQNLLRYAVKFFQKPIYRYIRVVVLMRPAFLLTAIAKRTE